MNLEWGKNWALEEAQQAEKDFIAFIRSKTRYMHKCHQREFILSSSFKGSGIMVLWSKHNHIGKNEEHDYMIPCMHGAREFEPDGSVKLEYCLEGWEEEAYGYTYLLANKIKLCYQHYQTHSASCVFQRLLALVRTQTKQEAMTLYLILLRVKLGDKTLYQIRHLITQYL